MNILKIAKIPAPAIESQCTVMDGIRMMEKENVGGVLVLQGGQLIGTFGERDVMLRVALSKKDPQTTLISEVMTAPAVTIDKSTTVGAALEIMREHPLPPPADCQRRRQGGGDGVHAIPAA